MNFEEIPIEKITKIQVAKDDVLVLKADRLLRDSDYEKIEQQISDKIGCKVAIVPSGFDTVTILNKLKDNYAFKAFNFSRNV